MARKKYQIGWTVRISDRVNRTSKTTLSNLKCSISFQEQFQFQKRVLMLLYLLKTFTRIHQPLFIQATGMAKKMHGDTSIYIYVIFLRLLNRCCCTMIWLNFRSTPLNMSSGWPHPKSFVPWCNARQFRGLIALRASLCSRVTPPPKSIRNGRLEIMLTDDSPVGTSS